MDDGYADGLREWDRAELAERRLDIAIKALKHLRQSHPATAPAVRLALRQIEASK